MEKIAITDIEALNKIKREIIELQKEIEKLNEVKLLKEKQKLQLQLNDKIEKLSTYDSEVIGNIIVKLMTEFEGIPYQRVENDFLVDKYLIEPKANDLEFSFIYLRYKLNIINNSDPYISNRLNLFGEFSKFKNLSIKKPGRVVENEKCLSVLLPSTFNIRERKVINDTYIQYFIDFLYEKRSNKLLYEITNEELEIILQEFLVISKDLQQQRKEEIAKKMKSCLQHKKRVEFEKSCLIDRKLIYRALTYIINNYEDNMSAKEEKEEKWFRSSQWSDIYGYHNLIIKTKNNDICFKAEVDCGGCYPDEEYCGVFVNVDKDTNICFFDFKEKIFPIIQDSLFVGKFMEMIENLYEEKRIISIDDIHQILVVISNDRKARKKILKKENEE